MMVDDYKCLSCSDIFEYKKPYGKDWPEVITCQKCGGMAIKSIKGKFCFVPEHMKAAIS